MTLLANRAVTTAAEDEVTNLDGRRNGHSANGRNILLSPKPAARPATVEVTPPEAALRTLQSRLEAQLTSGEESTDGHDDPGARFFVHSISRRLNQVNAALERIEEGKYGICTDCQEPIETDRLVLQPMSTRCTRCQAVAEWRGTAY